MEGRAPAAKMQADDDGDSIELLDQKPETMNHGSVSPARLPKQDQPSGAGDEGVRFEEADSLYGGYSETNVDSDVKTFAYWNKAAVIRDDLRIEVPQVKEPWEYIVYVSPGISEVLQEYDDEGDVSYHVRFTDDNVEQVS